MAIVRAVYHCHQNKIIHFDLKPENILVRIDETERRVIEVKLSDFGLSRSYNEQLRGGIDTLGTIFYFAPEMLKFDSPFDSRIDNWSLGIILHKMIIGDCPFTGKSDLQIA